jgi:hypothetical protein
MIAITADLQRRYGYGIKEIRYLGKRISVEEMVIVKLDPTRIGRALGDVETVFAGVDGYFYIRTVRRWRMDSFGREEVHRLMRRWREWCARPDSKPTRSEQEHKASLERNAWVPVFKFQRLTETQMLIHLVRLAAADSSAKRALIEAITSRPRTMRTDHPRSPVSTADQARGCVLPRQQAGGAGLPTENEMSLSIFKLVLGK